MKPASAMSEKSHGIRLTAVAKVLRPVGLRGEVAVKTWGDKKRRFDGLKTVYVGTSDENAREFRINGERTTSHHTVVKLDGIGSTEEASMLNDHYFFVREEDVPAPKHGTYFVDDILGSRVRTVEGVEVGVVRDVFRLPSNDLWSVWDGKKEVLVPAVKAFIRNVDTGLKEVVIEAPEGMVE